MQKIKQTEPKDPFPHYTDRDGVRYIHKDEYTKMQFDRERMQEILRERQNNYDGR